MEKFDILRIPLEGAHLVEANAGTGKTYALAGLFLRLILENHLAPGEILVVTYTRAATQELRDRIRKMIRQALDFPSGHTRVDPLVADLMNAQQDLKRPLEALTHAIRELDEAAVFTIHGFCQRLLQENAFETHSLFDVELTTRGQDLDQEIVEDFWRNHVSTAEPELVHFLFQKRWNTEYLLRFLNRALNHPYVRVIPAITTFRLPTLTAYRKILDTLRKRWAAARDDVRAMLMDPGIKGTSYGVTKAEAGAPSPRELRIRAMVAGMEQFLGAQLPLFPPFPDIERFSAGKLAASMKKGHLPPEHDFFALCQRLWEQKTALEGEMDQALIFMKGRLFHYLREERAKRKALRNVRTYQDLLTDALAALERDGKETLIRNARLKYRAALIDEFQDTDPVQYAIFNTLFGNGKTPLFYIGDPKQAIYGFRGADVVTYLKAAQSVPTTRTLRKNWRSEPELVRAVNTLFSGIEKPFVYPEITYTPSESAEKASSPVLRVEGDEKTPFRICLLRHPENGETFAPLAKKKAWPAIVEFVASEVARLAALGRSGRAFIGDKPLSERDMAILVRKNREARQMQDTLRNMGIPSVLYNAGDIFETREAVEVGLMLQAIADPGHEGHMKAALASDMMGMDGAAVHALAEQEDAWEERILDFNEYHRIWEEQGFIPMFRKLLTREKVRVRLLAFPDGERRLTNILHLGETLHHAALDERLGVNGLMTWLFRRMEDSKGGEEQLLRLETDEEAVKIVTIHKSKGLEYPVVFCPSLWDGGWSAEPEVIFHDPENALELTLDLGSDEKERHQHAAREELLAENLRLLYVALTRAQQRCYVAWGCIRDAETSPLAYVLHTRRARQDEPPVELARKALNSRPWKVLSDELSRLEQDSAGAIAVRDMNSSQWSGSPRAPKEATRLEGRAFSARIQKEWTISSFSSLSSRQKLDPDMPDYDFALPPEPSLEEEPEDTTTDSCSAIFAFPRGARAGTCLHDILEHVDFTKNEEQNTRNLIAEKLRAYGFADTWSDTIQDMVQKVLSTSLDPADPGLRLEKIGAKDRLHELEFLFPLKAITPDILARLFAGRGNPKLHGEMPQKIERLRFSPVRGFLKGFIDLVFQWHGRYYLVDWKSNFLGTSIEDYGAQGLGEAMEEGYYHLQYHLYTLALDQHLRAHLPGYRYESAFGGVFYLFLRGMDPVRGADFGIFRDRPSPDLVHRMRETLIQ